MNKTGSPGLRTLRWLRPKAVRAGPLYQPVHRCAACRWALRLRDSPVVTSGCFNCFFLRECSAEPHSKKDIYLYLNGSSISGAPAVLAFAKYRSLFLSTNGNCRPIAWITLCVKSFYNDIYPCQVSGLAQAFASHEGNLFDQLAIAQLEFHHGPRVATMPRQRRPAKLSEGPLDFPELGLWTSDPRPRTCRSLPPRSHPALGQARLRGTQEQRNTGPQERRGAGTSDDVTPGLRCTSGPSHTLRSCVLVLLLPPSFLIPLPPWRQGRSRPIFNKAAGRLPSEIIRRSCLLRKILLSSLLRVKRD